MGAKSLPLWGKVARPKAVTYEDVPKNYNFFSMFSLQTIDKLIILLYSNIEFTQMQLIGIDSSKGLDRDGEAAYAQSRAEQSRAEQSRAEQSRG